MKKVIGSFLFSLLAGHLFAQSFPIEIENVGRFSTGGLYGTAAYVGRAGAIGALGGDYMAASYNPAGLGVYRNSDISLSSFIGFNSIPSTYMNVKEVNHNNSVKFSNFGMVFNFKLKDAESVRALKSWQLSLGWNRLDDFDNKTHIKGNSNATLVDEWLDMAWGKPIGNLSDFNTGLAFDTDLIQLIPGSNNTYDSPAIGAGSLWKRKSIRERGGIDEFNLSISGNIDYKVYFGASLGIPDLYYSKDITYSETSNDPASEFQRFVYKENYKIEGKGLNLKLGVIVRPLDWVRLGVAYHTPTYYSIEDTYESNLETTLLSTRTTTSSASGVFFDEYSFISPSKFIGSIAFVLGNQTSKISGSLSADFEYLNYKEASYSSDDSYFPDFNTDIENIYNSAYNLKIGGALNIGTTVLRAGYSLLGSPYESVDIESDQQSVTFGIGFRNKWNYWEIAYVHTWKDSETGLYQTERDLPLAHVKTNKNMLVLTYGIRF